MTFVETLGDHAYTLELPSWVGLCTFPAIVAVVVLLMVAMRRPMLGVAVPVLVVVGVLAVRVLANEKATVPTLSTLFSRAELMVTVAVVASIFAVLASVLAGVVAFVDRRIALGGVSFAVALGGVLTALAASSVRSTIEARWNLPALLVPTSLEGHAGRSIEVTPEWATQAVRTCSLLVFCTWATGPSAAEPAPSGCETSKVTVRLDEGPTRAEVSGRCELGASVRLSLRRTFEARGLEEKGSALFPLRVGNEWRYRLVSTHHSGSVLWVFGGDTHTSTSDVALTLRIVGEVDLGAFRGFELELATKAATTKHVLVAAEGALWLLEDGARRPALVEQSDGRRSFVSIGPVSEWERGGDGLLPGPRRWLESSHDDGVGIVLAVLTIGLVIPPSSASWWELAETSEGEGVEVPNAPLPPAPATPPSTEPARALPARATAEGALLVEQVEPVLLKQRAGLEQCLRRHHAEPGALELSFAIAPSGKVSTAKVTGPAALAGCAQQWVRALTFPKAAKKTEVRQLVRLR